MEEVLGFIFMPTVEPWITWAISYGDICVLHLKPAFESSMDSTQFNVVLMISTDITRFCTNIEASCPSRMFPRLYLINGVK